MHIKYEKELNIYTKALLYDFINISTKDNTIIYDNYKKVSSFEKLKKILKLGHSRWSIIKSDIDKYNIIIKDKFLYINPIYFMHKEFIWYKEIFGLFKDSIEKNLQHFEYLKIKSKFYEVNHDIVCKDINELKQNLSGIYRLYKDDEILYIGKSKCIKNRIKEHLKDKDINSFDFTILSNESDKNIYEIYLIDKYKPILNKDCVEKVNSNIELDELIFSDKIKLRGDVDE